ncbi:unnamed protein product [Amoebophrya sp. A120]|nr:unnamed protein product [Amoebophrya sp. A120]|eukprot:GSA120T00001335001.1
MDHHENTEEVVGDGRAATEHPSAQPADASARSPDGDAHTTAAPATEAPEGTGTKDGPRREDTAAGDRGRANAVVEQPISLSLEEKLREKEEELARSERMRINLKTATEQLQKRVRDLGAANQSLTEEIKLARDTAEREKHAIAAEVEARCEQEFKRKQDEIQAQDTAISELKRLLQDAERSLKEMTSAAQTKDREVEEKKAALASLEAEFSKIEQEISLRSAEFASEQVAKNGTLEKMLQAEKQAVADLTAELAAQRAESSRALEESRADADAKMKELQMDTEEKFEKMRQEHASALEEQGGRFSLELSQEKEARERALDQQKNAYEAQLDDMQKGHDRSLSDIQATAAQELEEAKQHHAQELERRDREFADFRAGNEEECRALQEKWRATQSELEEWKRTRPASTEQALDTLEHDLTEILSFQKTAHSEVHKLQVVEEAAETLEREAAQLRQQVVILETRTRDLRSENEVLQEMKTDAFAKREDLLVELSTLRREYGKAQEQLARIVNQDARVQDLAAARTQLEIQNASLLQELTRLRQSNAALCRQLFQPDGAEDDHFGLGAEVEEPRRENSPVTSSDDESSSTSSSTSSDEEEQFSNQSPDHHHHHAGEVVQQLGAKKRRSKKQASTSMRQKNKRPQHGPAPTGDEEAAVILRGQRSMDEGEENRNVRQLATIARLQAKLIAVEHQALEEKTQLFDRIRELEHNGYTGSGTNVAGRGPTSTNVSSTASPGGGGGAPGGGLTTLAGLNKLSEQRRSSPTTDPQGSVSQRMGALVSGVFGSGR